MEEKIKEFNKNRSVGSHKFKMNGECEYCQETFKTMKMKMCRVITPDEVASWKI